MRNRGNAKLGSNNHFGNQKALDLANIFIVWLFGTKRIGSSIIFRKSKAISKEKHFHRFQVYKYSKNTGAVNP